MSMAAAFLFMEDDHTRLTPEARQGSPFYSFDRESVGWLLRQSEAGKPLTREDVARVLKAVLAHGHYMDFAIPFPHQPHAPGG